VGFECSIEENKTFYSVELSVMMQKQLSIESIKFVESRGPVYFPHRIITEERNQKKIKDVGAIESSAT
jgi:hypothetical protein